MLLRITKYCEMDCPHCLVSADRNGQHMSSKTFEASLGFLLRIRPRVMMVSGGEPFNHPHVFEILEQLIKTLKLDPRLVMVTSNGLPLQNDPSMLARARSLGVSLQVTNDPLYYPRRVVVPGVPMMENIPGGIFPDGRAVTSDLSNKPQQNFPYCFNFRSLLRSGMSLPMAVAYLEVNGKYCLPAVDVDGSVRIGEGGGCWAIGSVQSSIPELEAGIRDCRCSRCGLKKNLSPSHLAVIGESA